MTDFDVYTLPFCSFGPEPHVGVGVREEILDLTLASVRLLPAHAGLFEQGNLDRFLAAGPGVWAEVRAALASWIADGSAEEFLIPADGAELRLPFTVADYVDFYASEYHATNLGRIFRPDQEPLTPNWKHMPIGYHGRAGTVVCSGTPIVRPNGQRRSPEGEIIFGPSAKLDIEAELGFVVGVPSALGEPVGLDDFDKHVFGVCLVNDWSARDIQAWEYVPLGPFLGKSFATSVSPWVVPLAALEHARVRPPERSEPLQPYLDDSNAPPWGFDIRLEVSLNGHRISSPPFAGMYWTAAQQLAHMTVNGASLRTGDLFASGTISGPDRGERGALIELTWNGRDPVLLPDGSQRTFLEDGDEVVISASAPGLDGSTIELGEVRGTVASARELG